jgi:nicotinamide riboside transporter PnuC
MTDPMLWVITAGSLVGLCFNIAKHRFCFAIWAVTNAVWVAVDLEHGLPQQAALQAVYFGMSIYGFIAWRNPEPLASQPDPRAAADIHPSPTEAQS